MAADERERAVAFLWATDRAVAGAVAAATVTGPGGEDRGARAWLASDTRFPLLWDANFLYVGSPGDATAADLAAATTEGLRDVGGSLGGVVIAAEADGPPLRDAFADIGWRAGPLVLMVHRDADRLGAGDGVRRVSDEEAAPPRRAVILAEGWGSGAVADQVLARAALVAAATGGVSYGAEGDDGVASTCVVLGGDGLAQVDDVGTAPPARRRGLAGAVVSFATERARDEGSLVFLCADALDWPQHLYERLGYEPVGTLHRFFPVLPVPTGRRSAR
jgi:ribosomal protein S18 acetylase RimI-like enzyme